jgi:hypothetical protein
MVHTLRDHRGDAQPGGDSQDPSCGSIHHLTVSPNNVAMDPYRLPNFPPTNSKRVAREFDERRRFAHFGFAIEGDFDSRHGFSAEKRAGFIHSRSSVLNDNHER